MNDNNELIGGKQNWKGETFPDLISFLFEVNKILDDFNEKIQSPNSLLDIDSLKNHRGKRKDVVDRYFDSIGFVKNSHSNLKAKTGNFNDYKGLYIYCKSYEGKYQPVYIGISQRIYQRIVGHVFRSTKSSATWAYLIAKYKNGGKGLNSDEEEKKAI